MRHSFGALHALLISSINFYWASAIPLQFSNETADYDFINTNSSYDPRQVESRDDKVLLRVMPLGASITQGIVAGMDEASDEGYRRLLRDQLRYWGYEVNMVGSRAHGNFADHQHEGHPGYQIAAIDAIAKNSYTTRKPNLVLINAGTNDCVQADDRTYTPLPGGTEFVQGTKDRIKSMIQNVFDASEGVTIIMSTLINNQETATNNYIDVANTGYRDLVVEMQGQGAKIEMADMNTGFITLDDHSDVTHPNANGYEKMAAVWAAAFKKVEAKGWLVAPIDSGNASDSSCYPTPEGFRGPVQTQQGSGYSDGGYSHSSSLDATTTYYGAAPRSLVGEWNHFHFAQLVSSGGDEDKGKPLDELIRILDPEDRKLNNLPYMSYQINKGDGSFDAWYNAVKIVEDGTPECLSRGVRFGDINGDGLDDFICINSAGSLYVSLNRGGSPPKFEYIGLIREDIYTQANVRLADIDGDGRLDYCGLDGRGGMSCFRNGGTGDAPIAKYGGFWQGMLLDGGGTTFDDNVIALPDAYGGLNLVDINGDGRADWVYFYPDTSSVIYINQRGSKRDDGKGLHPHWVKALSAIGGWAGDDSVNTTGLLFGNIYGSGRADLVRVEQVGKNFDYKFNFHRNTGNGGRKVRGDGANYCSMYGRGYDDYLWVWEGGMIDLFENVNPGSEYMWYDRGRILETATDRKWIQFGDWDGDGLCDVLATDRATGNVRMWRNKGASGGKPTFETPVEVVSGGLCPQDWNPNPTDLAVRFGDLNGDGRVDYLCMDPDGRTRGWLNKASGVEAMSPNQIKVSVGFDRANYRWADVNGDGLVDFLWVDKHTGNVQTWINGGIKSALDSSMYWDQQKDIWMSGVERGANIHFPKLSASGRADYHWVHPQDGTAWTYFNEACGTGDGNAGGPDDGTITDPNLPTVPGDGDGGSTLCPRADANCVEPEQAVIAAASSKYPRVDWVKTAETCKEPTFSGLVATHGRAIDMYQLTGSDLTTAFQTTGFNRYFVQSTSWLEVDAFTSQSGKYAAVLDWAAGQPPPGGKQSDRITYYCKDPSWVTSSDDKCWETGNEKVGIGAKTFVLPTKNPNCQRCMQMTLCPAFFSQSNVDDITATSHRVEELPYQKGITFSSREHTLIHEWFHNGLNDAQPSTIYSIIDMKAYLASEGGYKQMYGAGITSQWAWQGFGSGPIISGSIDTSTMNNADSFAWMISYNWYEKAWGWTDDGRWKDQWRVSQKRGISAIWKRLSEAVWGKGKE